MKRSATYARTPTGLEIIDADWLTEITRVYPAGRLESLKRESRPCTCTTLRTLAAAVMVVLTGCAVAPPAGAVGVDCVTDNPPLFTQWTPASYVVYTDTAGDERAVDTTGTAVLPCPAGNACRIYYECHVEPVQGVCK